MIPAVNFHLWQPCNMGCKFCFATFLDVKHNFNLPKGHLPEAEALAVVDELADIGFEKITFAGGEPTLCPWLTILVARAKQRGMTTMVVTNGSRLTDELLTELRPHLDWVALSIDSLDHDTNTKSGRVLKGVMGRMPFNYFEVIDRVKAHGFGLKINTVVHGLNLNEDFSELIHYAAPKRWKLFQVLPMEGQNSGSVEPMLITTEQFLGFVSRHAHLEQVTNVVPETNSDMKGSYAMVSPAGQFYDNVDGRHHYSRPILEMGARLAIQQVRYDFEKFLNRNGHYNWAISREFPTRITFSGEVASGKSRVGRLLAEKLGYRFISIGEKTRQLAHRNGMDIVQFQQKCTENPEIDREIDRAFAAECSESEKLVIDYRLGFKFVPNAFHIFLKVSEDVATERLRMADRLYETHETIGFRNECFRKQFLNSYGVDYTLPKHYDLVLEVDHATPEELVDQIITVLKNRSTR